MTPERLANLKAKITNARLDWKLAAGDEPCDLLDANAELIAEIERLTAVVTDPTFTRANPRAGVSVTTPPTPDLTALEQWARETAKAQPYTVWASRADAILALIASWREGQQEKTALYAEFRKMVDTSMSCLDERDAAIARAAHAEQERDEADTALAACQSQSSGIIARLTDERDKAIDMVADIGKPLGQLSMPQIHCNADVVKALRQRELEAKAERDAARAEAAKAKAEQAKCKQALDHEEWLRLYRAEAQR